MLAALGVVLAIRSRSCCRRPASDSSCDSNHSPSVTDDDLDGGSTSACRCTTTSNSPVRRIGPSPITTSDFSSGRPAAVKASAMSRGPTEPYSLPSVEALAAIVTLAPSSSRRASAPAEDLARLGLVLGATLLELGDVGGGGRHGLALRDEEVAAVARLDLDLVAEVAEVGDFLQQDQFHGVAPYSLAARQPQRDGCPNGWTGVCGSSTRRPQWLSQ
jgi:hypothetical protein